MVHNSNIYYSARMACSVPEFIELQRNSFYKLLADGISEEFAKITPLCLENNSLKVIFYAEKYQLLLPENSARDCIFNLKSYASKLYILAKLISKKSKQEVLQWVLVGNLPIMTRRGHFIINGSPRVVVHQVVRSPGVYFQQRRGSSEQPRFYADFISRRGAWLRIQTDKRREFLARLKNGKKIEAALLRECFQFMESQQREENTNNEYIWRSRLFNRAFEELFSDSSVVSKYANEKAYNYLYKRFKNPKSYDLGKIGRQHINKKLKLSIKSDQLTSVDIDATLKHLVNLETGDKILDDIDHFKNRRVRTSGELLQNQFEVGVYRLEKLVITKLNIKLKELEIVLRDTLREKSKQSFLVNDQRSDTKIDMNTVNQRLEPLASNRNSNSEQGLQIGNSSQSDIFHKEKERHKSIESKPNQYYNTSTKDVSVTNVELIEGIEDSIEQKTKTTRSTYGTRKETIILPQKKIFESDRNWDKRVLNLSLKSKISATLKNVINSKPLNSAFREFFGTNPLSHYMDQTNPLAEITHKRRLCSLGLGGVSQDTAGMAVRGIHPSHYGRVCPIETPEGKNAGLMNSLSIYTTINSMGFLETPCYQVFQGQVQREKGLFFISAQRESEERFNLAPGDLQLSRTHLLEKMSVPVRAADSFIDEFRKVCSDEVDYMAISPIQMISIATSLIPFLEHDDANRALMGSNMQRQAVPLMIAERPLIGTGLESLVVAESGHVLQTESSGFVSYVSSERIVVDNFLDYYPLSFGDNLLSKAMPFKQKLCKPLISYLPLIEANDNDCFRSFSKNTPLSDNYIRRPFQWLSGVQENQHSKDVVDSTTFGFKRSRIASIKDKSSFSFLTRSCPKDIKKNLISKIERKDVSSLDINHFLQNYERSNQDTCLTQKALVREGEWVQQGDVLADCSASSFGELALGKNILVAYIPWEGYNFEDAIVINQRLIDEDVYTSIHIERYELDTRENEYGKEQITYFIPGTSLKQKKHLTRMGIAKIGSWLSAGDILVGKRTPLEPQPLTPYQKLLYDIMNKVAPREKDTSLRLPKGVHGRVIKYKISEDTHLSFTKGDQRSITEEKQKKETYIQSKVVENNATFSKSPICAAFGSVRRTTPTNLTLSQKPSKRRNDFSESSEEKRRLYKAHSNLWMTNGSHFTESVETAAITRQIKTTSVKPKLMPYQSSISALSMKREENEIHQDLGNTSPKMVLKQNKHAVSSGSLTYGEQRWVEPNYALGRNYTKKNRGEFGLKNIHVYVAEKRKIQIGDKMSGRHGNKGIVSLIMPRQDMPYLPDGTPIDILLNPLGVPSRMNVGQVFECLLGLSASKLGQQLKITPFDEIYGAEASKSLVYLKLYQARLKSGQDWLFQLDFPGKTILFDGRSGECFDQWVTVGRAYVLKLIHLVAEKIHARATGPYALITQQPLGGRSKNGGQRLGEMEVWALEGFGAAYTLQELLTKKSDDEQGRKQVIETILKIEPSSPFTAEKFSERKERLKKLGSPEIFQVLVKELQSLCLGIGIYSLVSHPLKKEQIDVV